MPESWFETLVDDCSLKLQIIVFVIPSKFFFSFNREDLMMNGDAWSSASTTTTTTPRPHRPRKSKLFVANVWG